MRQDYDTIFSENVSRRGVNIPLPLVVPGTRVQLNEVRAGHALGARLASMGLYPGVEVEVVSGSSRGPVVVALDGARVVLGQSVARKILAGQPI